MQTRTAEKYLETFDYEWGGERKEIKIRDRSKEWVFFYNMEDNFHMFTILKADKKDPVKNEKFNV